MEQKRERVSICLDKDLHFKLSIVSFGQKYGLGNKNASMSGIVNDAVREYLVNHSDEVDRAMDEFRKRGVLPE